MDPVPGTLPATVTARTRDHRKSWHPPTSRVPVPSRCHSCPFALTTIFPSRPGTRTIVIHVQFLPAPAPSAIKQAYSSSVDLPRAVGHVRVLRERVQRAEPGETEAEERRDLVPEPVLEVRGVVGAVGVGVVL